ncbi:hypothetical protein LDFHOB_09550 [Candidatus Electronema aureum]
MQVSMARPSRAFARLSLQEVLSRVSVSVLGIDVAKAKLDVALLLPDGNEVISQHTERI